MTSLFGILNNEVMSPNSGRMLENARRQAPLMGRILAMAIQMESAAPEWWSRYIASMAYLLYYHAPDAEQLCSEMCVLQTLSDAGKAK